MDFINDAVDIQLLPKAEEVVLRPIEKSYLTVIRIEWAISSAVLLVTAIILIFSIKALQQFQWISGIAGAWLLVSVGYVFYQAKSFAQKAYALREKDVIYRSGWLVQKTRTCPFNRIQHSSVSTGFFERNYGLASLILYTAGTDDADLRIPGLTERDAHAMKEWITQKIIHEDEPGT